MVLELSGVTNLTVGQQAPLEVQEHWTDTVVEIKGLPTKVRVKHDKAKTPLEFRRNEITDHAVRLVWKFKVGHVPTLKDPRLVIEVTDSRNQTSRVEVWDPKQELVTCNCEEWFSDQSGWCDHTAAWVGFWKNSTLWTLPREEKDGTISPPLLVTPSSPGLTNWKMKVLVVLRKIPKGPALWHVATKVYDSSVGKCRLLGLKTLLDIASMTGVYLESESTTVARALVQKRKAQESPGGLDPLEGVDPDNLISGGISLYPYQKEAMKKMLSAKRAICSMAIGAGKTACTIATVAAMRKPVDVLVIATKTLAEQWGRETERFLPDQARVVFANETEEWESKLDHSGGDSRSRFTITTYQYIQRNVDRFQSKHWDVVVADEIQFVRNGDSKTWRAIKEVRSEYFFGLSGTVIENRLDDLYSVMEIVSPGSLGPKWKFLSDFQEVNDITPTQILFGDLKNLPALHTKLDPWVYILPPSVTSARLPPMTHAPIYAVLPPDQRALHDDYYERAKVLMAKALQGPISHGEKMMIQAFLLKARQACNTTELITKVKPSRRPAKICQLLTLLHDQVRAGEKTVVFSQWTEMLDICKREIAQDLPGIKVAVLDGSMSVRARRAAVLAFQSDPECMVFLASDAGGVGLDGLQLVSSTVVHTELPWNPAKLDQRNGRLHRIGQTKPTCVTTMVALDSIESKMEELLVSKREIREQVLLMT